MVAVGGKSGELCVPGDLRGGHCQGALLISSLPPRQTARLLLTPLLLLLKDRRVRILPSLLLLNALQVLRLVTILPRFFLHRMTRRVDELLERLVSVGKVRGAVAGGEFVRVVDRSPSRCFLSSFSVLFGKQ